MFEEYVPQSCVGSCCLPEFFLQEISSRNFVRIPPPPPKNTRYLENNTWLSQIVQAVRAHGKLMISVFRIFPRTRNARQPTSIPPDYGVNTMVHACTVPTANATTNVFSYVGGRGYRRHVACIRMFSCILLFVLQLLL